jgi:hypothetical protein
MSYSRRTPQQKDPQNYPRPQGADEMPSQARHAGKEAYDLEHACSGLSKPSAGVTLHPAKAQGKNRTEPLSQPGPSGGHVRDSKLKTTNREEPLSAPSAGPHKKK